ncbi:delta(24)-sterol reductase-like isoform X4 [Daktulosphaira vitifoliae]|uniref:delta(24)-sterol reductase-like isoform X3 n=1 Tax=Daktulosphaira vitifoliae TaxID=58002 RepID=UPI0021AA7A80|nr:delta(24)-sterol reductase-like isoform X3 [Daktulosphaira vitifoliae]XP_050529829.1 delta(24)-sterol reductase-like isoform X4 [Daktulosphaira vitifoliae]
MDIEIFLENFLFNYRWVFVCLFVLPCTILGKAWSIWETFGGARYDRGHHNDNVKKIQQHIKRRNEKAPNLMMCTSRPSWKCLSLDNMLYKKYMYNIDVHLNNVLSIDVKNETVQVEPGITFGRLVPELIRFGWTLPIVADLRDLTIGGIIMGTGLETSSHKYGFFHNVCTRYEIVTGNGDLMTCSKTENAELFECIPCSYGTLGFLTAVEMKIIPAKNYVLLKYHPIIGSTEQLEKTLAHEVENDNDFVEILMFSQTESVLITGQMTNEKNKEGIVINKIGRFYKPWFFKYVESFLETNEKKEFIPLQDYYFRHESCLFWQIKDIIPFSNHPIFRVLLGWSMPPKISLLKLTQTDIIKRIYRKKHFVDDFIVPLSSIAETIKLTKNNLNIFPIWICPVILRPGNGLIHSHSNEEKMYVDVGLYGFTNVHEFNSNTTSRNLELSLIKLKGYKMLYNSTNLTLNEFKLMFNHNLYNKLRQKLNCEYNLPELYDKVNKSARN